MRMMMEYLDTLPTYKLLELLSYSIILMFIGLIFLVYKSDVDGPFIMIALRSLNEK
jgi:hypothetical protein